MSDPNLDPALNPKQTVTNDAVAGETVLPADSYGGPNGAQPEEVTPLYAENDLAGEQIDLDDTVDAGDAGHASAVTED